MNYNIKDDSQKVYNKFIENYSDSEKYNDEVNSYFEEYPDENNSILKITFFKLIKLYIGICLLLLLAKLVLPYNTFGGFSWDKLFNIYGVFLLIFGFLFILSIANIPDKKSIIQADLAMYDTLSCLGIIDSKKRIEVIDMLIEDKVGVGDFYIKLLNVLKNNNIIKYFLWLSSIFIGLYTGFINGVFSKNMDNTSEVITKPLKYIYFIGKQLGVIFLVILVISSLYYITIDFAYKQKKNKYDLYFLSLNNIKYRLLLNENISQGSRKCNTEDDLK